MSKTGISTTQLRGYETLKALFGHEVNGIPLLDLSERFGANRGAVLRDLQTLEEAGLAEQLPNKNWRISPEFGKQAVKIFNNMSTARSQLEEAMNRYGVNG